MLEEDKKMTELWKLSFQKFLIVTIISFIFVTVFFSLPIDFLLAIGINGMFQSETLPYNLFDKIQWSEKGFLAIFLGIKSLFSSKSIQKPL